MTRRLLFFAVLAGAAVAVVPWLFPTGSDAGLDASRFLASGRLAVGAAIVFAGGFLTSLTPCVYPLIPITVSVFGARKAESRAKSILLTSSYVVGMGAIFSVLGVVAAKTGQAFGSVLGNPWFVAFLAAFLLALAASMFGAFELAVPSGLAQKLNTVGGAGVLGAFLMGTVSGFLTAPCTGPVLTGLLAFVAKSQSMALGAGLLFIYALGIGVPFFAIGVFTVRLPKGGVWMEWVKSVLGILLVALAVSYLRDAINPIHEGIARRAAQLGHVPGAWISGGLVVIGILLGAVHRSFKEGTREFALKAVGVTAIVLAVLLRAGALNERGPGELWVALGWAQKPAPVELAWSYRFGIDDRSIPSFEQKLAQARASGKPVMIDFFAEWCAACKELDRETYVSPMVAEEASRFVSIKVDATNEDEAIQALYDRFGIQGLPTVAFFSSAGALLQEPRVTGFMGPEKFAAQLRRVR